MRIQVTEAANMAQENSGTRSSRSPAGLCVTTVVAIVTDPRASEAITAASETLPSALAS